MNEAPKRVVIIGGGVGGVSAAAELRASGFDGEITLVDAGEVPYDRPALSKGYLSGKLTLQEIALQPPGWYERQSVRLVANTRAVGIWATEGCVELSTGERLPTDRVVLATGGHAALPPVPGIESARVHALRDREDADALREALVPGSRILVVGGGLVGAETASTALDLGAEVTLIEPAPVPLEAVVGPEVGEWLHGMHAARGITTIRAALEELEDTGTEVLARYTGSEQHQAFDAVIVGVGLRPETSLAKVHGLEVDRGIVVDSRQRTRCPAVLAVGDSTRRRIRGVLQPRAEHWEAAQRGGQRAAATILGLEAPVETAPWFWSERHGVHVEAVGNMAKATTRVVRRCRDEGSFSVWGLREGHVVSVAAVDDATAIRAGRRMIDRGAAVVVAQLADPACDLRGLARGAVA